MTLFEEIILKDSTICNNCFRKTHSQEVDWFPYSRKNTTSEGMFQNPRTFHRPSEVEEAYIRTSRNTSEKRYSCKCGSINRQKHRSGSLTVSELMGDFIPRVINRLDESMLPYDEDVLENTARDLKTGEMSRGSDDRIISDAISKASYWPISVFRRMEQREFESEEKSDPFVRNSDTPYAK